MKTRFQVTLTDLLLITAVVAATVATLSSHEATIVFIALSVLVLFIWWRPVVMRFWCVGIIGGGAANLVCGVLTMRVGQTYILAAGMTSMDLAAWGAGWLVGGIVACRLFLRDPPPLPPCSP